MSDEAPRRRRLGGRKGRKKDPNAPKRPLTAFVLWANDNRARLRTENPEITFGEMSKRLGDEWKQLSSDMKKPYEESAEREKEAFKQVKAQYDQRKADEASSSSSEGEGGRRKTKRKRKDPNAPKAALSFYIHFSKAERPIIRQEYPEATFGEIGRLLGERWKALPEEEKQKFHKLSEEDRKRYEQEMEAYRKGAFVRGESMSDPRAEEEERGRGEEEEEEEEEEDEEDDDGNEIVDE